MTFQPSCSFNYLAIVPSAFAPVTRTHTTDWVFCLIIKFSFLIHSGFKSDLRHIKRALARQFQVWVSHENYPWFTISGADGEDMRNW